MTLPWLIYGYAGSYRMAEAALASLLLLTICALLVFFFERHQTRNPNRSAKSHTDQPPPSGRRVDRETP